MADKFTLWMKTGGYLPKPLRDFHDQKDTFKTIHEIIHNHEATKQISWIQAHLYVIDVFLWFMALRGYTLQKSRQKHDFADLEGTVKEHMKARSEAIYEAMKKERTS